MNDNDQSNVVPPFAEPASKQCISPLATRPVLYTDTIMGGQQTMRDDLWAVSTEELNYLHNTIKQAKIVEDIQKATIKRLKEQQDQQRPDFLLEGTRFKLNFSTRGNVDVFHNYASELQGRWVALVSAEDDVHLSSKVVDDLKQAGALRQFKHNDGSEGFVFAYDIDVTEGLIGHIVSQRVRAALKEAGQGA